VVKSELASSLYLIERERLALLPLTVKQTARVRDLFHESITKYYNE
jgi:hypothetical protein